ncbi:hypothetical protein C2U70_28415 [Bradyrhizobium guangdongense]|uniref:hypothetical protein n=1 Tax=Bradyrhizobium guangdongense TaxID=1325090 RepID=UPI00112CB3D3|nr:hypothetical protein [Bradyrhizobium guangdongense]TPQ29523.1 hypothetical protein C2U70_28415 [Bradyrhizobium guangdongense]
MTPATDYPTKPTIVPDDRAKGDTPRIKVSSRGFWIDHPDRQLGEQLMMEALGAPDREALNGILKQLVNASVNGRKPDKSDLPLMISLMKSIRPRDAIEAMLVAQMVSVHVIAMRCAHRLAGADDIASQDSRTLPLVRLLRTFPAQIDALNRYRNRGQPAGAQDSDPITRIERVIVYPPRREDEPIGAKDVPTHDAGEREGVSVWRDLHR